jgi:hypothetical protein
VLKFRGKDSQDSILVNKNIVNCRSNTYEKLGEKC